MGMGPFTNPPPSRTVRTPPGGSRRVPSASVRLAHSCSVALRLLHGQQSTCRLPRSSASHGCRDLGRMWSAFNASVAPHLTHQGCAALTSADSWRHASERSKAGQMDRRRLRFGATCTSAVASTVSGADSWHSACTSPAPRCSPSASTSAGRRCGHLRSTMSTSSRSSADGSCMVSAH